jgi:competence protein ComEC
VDKTHHMPLHRFPAHLLSQLGWFFPVFIIMILILNAAIPSDVAAKPLDTWSRVFPVTGRLESLEPRGNRWRLVIVPHALQNLDPGTPLPRHIQIGAGGKALPEGVRLGDTVSALVMLGRPTGPVAPGAFDYQKWLYDKEIDATGFVLGKVTRIGPPADGPTLAERLDQFRLDLSNRLMAGSPDPRSGALAVAFTTGIRGFLPETDVEAMRVAGLTHLLSISGTHMALVAGLAYALFRRGLLLVPRTAGGTGKPLAAFLAIVATGCYLLISGMSIPTVRSFITVLLAMLAVIFHRQPFSLWTVALAAMGILAVRPDALGDAGFQMSFAAVTALIVFYQRTTPTPAGWPWWRRMLRYFWLVNLSTLVVTLATAPISAWHFHRFPLYGALGNMVALPASGILVMPPLMAALVAAPFGFEGIFLHLAAPGLRLILGTSTVLAGWPYGEFAIPAFPGTAAVLLMGAAALVAFLKRHWRLMALPPALAGVVLILTTPQPDIVVAPDGRQVGFLLPDKLLVATWKPNGFLLEQWQERYGYHTVEQLRLDRPKTLPDTCRDGSCFVTLPDNTRVWLPLHWDAFRAGCPAADVVIAPYYLPEGCGQRVRLGRTAFMANGAHAVYLKDGTLLHDRDILGVTPWSWNLLSVAEQESAR